MSSPAATARWRRPWFLGLLTAGLALLVFALVAAHVTGATALTAWDRQVADRLHEHALTAPGTVAVFTGVTTLGNGNVLVLLAVGVCLALLMRGQYSLALAWLLVTFGGEMVNQGAKAYFQRARPLFAEPILPRPHSASFPSGHAMGALVLFGFLSYLLLLPVPARRPRSFLVGALIVVALLFTLRWFAPSYYGGNLAQVWEIAYGLLGYLVLLTPLPPWARKALLGAFCLLVLGIGFSRCYLGAHWCSDVVGGFALGGAWLALTISALAVRRRDKDCPAALADTPKGL